MVVRETKNREWLFILFLLLCIFQVPLALNFGIFAYYDELIPFLIISVMIIDLIRAKGSKWYPKKLLAIMCLLIVFWAIGWISWSRSHLMPFKNGFLDSFANLKFYISIVVSWLLFKEIDYEHLWKLLWNILRAITLILFVLTIFDEIFHIFPGEFRYGIMCIRLFFGHYTLMVAACVLMCSIFIRMYEFYKERVLPWILMQFVMLFFTMRTKAWLALLAFAVLFFYVCRKRRKISKVAWLVVILMVVVISFNQVSYYFVELGEESARYFLIVTSPVIARDFFPLGSGWATFGSGFSAEPYSPIYSMYNINYVWGLTIDRPAYISDCFWPMILAETGLFGLLTYASALLILLKGVFDLGKKNAYAFASALGALAYLIIASTSEASFTLGYASHFGIWLGIIFAESNGRIRFLPMRKTLGYDDSKRLTAHL